MKTTFGKRSRPRSAYPAEAILLDGPSSGHPFDWSIGAGFPGNLIVAGGLDENNVREAVAAEIGISGGSDSARWTFKRAPVRLVDWGGVSGESDCGWRPR